MFDQSGVWVNTLQDLIKEKVSEYIAQGIRLGGQSYQNRPEEPHQYWHGKEYHYMQETVPHQYNTENERKNESADRIVETVREQFGIKPKEQIYVYHRPYPEWFDRVPLPYQYKVLDFSMFSGKDNISTMEHVSRFLTQCGEASAEEALRVRFFPLSLTGSAFTWFSSLPANSIGGWADLEKQFHHYFFAGVNEMRLSDLASVKQQADESFLGYIQRLHDVRSRCYSLNLSDGQLADLAF